MKRILQTFICAAVVTTASAQLSTNPDKFLGNITTRYQMDAGGGVPQFYKLWNQVTCENESKWGSVEGTRNSYNWGCDNAFNYAKDSVKHKPFTYKFHALVWGAQYPNWLPNLTPKDRFAAIVKWFDAVKKKYSTLPLIDVVNEAVGTHQAGNPMMKESLGGGGKTGYDWLIKAFEMAFERWPDAILIYNDYNTFQWNTNEYIELVQTLRDAGAPIDAYGCQSHDLTDCNVNNFKRTENPDSPEDADVLDGVRHRYSRRQPAAATLQGADTLYVGEELLRRHYPLGLCLWCHVDYRRQLRPL